MATIWEELNTKQVGDAPSEAIQSLSDPVHIEASNVGVLSSIDLINKATMRADGGIIPDTIECKVADYDDNASVSVLVPKKGEVWRVFCPIAKLTAGSTANTTYQYFIKDTASGREYRVYYMANTSASPILTEDRSLSEVWTIGYGQELVCELVTIGTGGKISAGVLAGRVR